MKKNKFIIMFAAFIIIAAFLLPVTVFADDNTELPSISNSNQEDEITDIDKTDIGISISYDELLAILEFFNTFGKTETDEDTTETPNESVTPDDTTKPFTPDGQASVVDLAYEGDGKMFYTFKTPAGNVFYLIIDRQRDGDNVYFLNAVTESDLLALTKNIDNKDVGTSAIPNNTTPKDETTTNITDNTETPTTNKPSEQKNGNTGLIIFIVIGAVVLCGVGYYFKVLRPKQQAKIDDDDDDIPNDDDSNDLQFEDDSDDYSDNDTEAE